MLHIINRRSEPITRRRFLCLSLHEKLQSYQGEVLILRQDKRRDDMTKVQLGPETLVYPMPVFLVGASVGGKPNFMAVAWGGIVNGSPPMVSVSIVSTRYTFKGICENMVFSVNIPTVDMVKEVDYCGITSGSRVNKVSVCGFRVFYGKLEAAPLIEQCPVNLECRVAHIMDMGSNLLVIGRIEETHVSEDCLIDGKPDVTRIRPFAYVTSPAQQYQSLGNIIADAFSVGRELGEKV
jgi:flavin reductase (DIM6/NTAB) family NADH-FMN oxidoreductase RutF